METTVWLISDSILHARRLERRRQDHGTRGNSRPVRSPWLDGEFDSKYDVEYYLHCKDVELLKGAYISPREALGKLAADEKEYNDYLSSLANAREEDRMRQVQQEEDDYWQWCYEEVAWNQYQTGRTLSYEEYLAWEEYEDRYWSGFDLTPEELEKREKEEHDLEVMEDNEWEMTHDQDFWDALYEGREEVYLQQH